MLRSIFNLILWIPKKYKKITWFVWNKGGAYCPLWATAGQTAEIDLRNNMICWLLLFLHNIPSESLYDATFSTSVVSLCSLRQFFSEILKSCIFVYNLLYYTKCHTNLWNDVSYSGAEIKPKDSDLRKWSQWPSLV